MHTDLLNLPAFPHRALDRVLNDIDIPADGPDAIALAMHLLRDRYGPAAHLVRIEHETYTGPGCSSTRVMWQAVLERDGNEVRCNGNAPGVAVGRLITEAARGDSGAKPMELARLPEAYAAAQEDESDEYRGARWGVGVRRWPVPRGFKTPAAIERRTSWKRKRSSR